MNKQLDINELKHDLPKRSKHIETDHALVSIAAPSIELHYKLKQTRSILESFKIPYESSIVAAHRAPKKTLRYINELEDRGIEIIIACGSGSAHLPGMISSLTSIPVIGVPLVSNRLGGIDSLLSMVQMPTGVPVAVVGIFSAQRGHYGLPDTKLEV